MKTDKLRGKWALVTGASSGFGADFARILASMGCNLVITARRSDRLGTLKQEITKEYAVSVKCLINDLSIPGSAGQLYDQVKAAGIEIDVLINNAGFGIYGPFVEVEWERHQEMLQLNILSMAHLTRLFAADMVARKAGYILHIASNAAYQPTPMFAAYGASKSFVLNFSEALHDELRGTGVHCTVLSPGPVTTGFQSAAGIRDNHPYVLLNPLSSTQIAQIGIHAMLKGRSSHIPGWTVYLVAQISRLAPRRLAAAVTGWLMRLP